MALVLPVLVILLFGIIEFGIAFAQKLALSNAARQGARYAAVPNYDSTGAGTTTCATILSQVQGAASTIGVTTTNVGVTITSPSGGQTCATSSGKPAKSAGDFQTSSNQPCVGSSSGGNVTVTASYPGSIQVPFGPNVSSFTLTGTGVYQCEYSS